MPGQRPRVSLPIALFAAVAATAALALTLLFPAVALAQVGPYKPPPYAQPYGQPPPYAQPYGQPPPYVQPYGQPPPYAQPYPQPYGQPPPYAQPSSAPSYGYAPQSSPRREDLLSANAHSWPVLRASNGVGMHFVGDRDATVSFDFDASAGYRWAFHRRAFLVFEGGYSFITEPRFGGHFATLGVGAELYLHRHVGIGWTPKLVVGESWDGLGIGVRNTLVVPLLMRVFHIEIGHQYLRVEDRHQHEVRAQIGVDLAASIHLLLWLLVPPAR